MDFLQIKEKAKENLKGYCRICTFCNGRACAGEVPGMGGVGSGSAFMANLEALARYRLNMRTIHEAKDPDTSLTLFGLKLQPPILAAPITGTPYNMGGALTEREFIGMIISGSRQAGSLGFSGDGAVPGLYESGVDAITAESGWGIPIIKPRSQEAIIEKIQQAENAGAPAVGIDIDGAGLVTMTLKGQPVGPKSREELKEIIKSTRLPFILKGIMTVDEAEAAVEIGASAIVVSNHGGRILDHTPGAAEVLPGIVKAVGKNITVLADGGVRSGTDALKLLALGAYAVLVGRPLITGAFGGGAEGVKFILSMMTAELTQSMILTGCGTLAEIDNRILV
ncbi:alpha-hydroxy-acid oxidizing protein [Pelotomaculum propionicicum]|uniref:L-lactate oxidase n=1 Tax=Pelotomaculum propionicicum TaxID=258475 RepID=A0A4Y7RJ75_9FIRM|nr:alpha-hydroxy-acid oxidizing protein [Pelotomaculum propionicicum]TEB08883.1 4-hydroxymandelate oxidase [Pelotomaculum propionicicum]